MLKLIGKEIFTLKNLLMTQSCIFLANGSIVLYTSSNKPSREILVRFVLATSEGSEETAHLRSSTNSLAVRKQYVWNG